MSYCPGPEHGVLCIATVDLISRISLLELFLLRASNYYYRKCSVCYILTFYSQYRYGEVINIVYFYFIAIYTCLGSFAAFVSVNTNNMLFSLCFI